MAFLSRDEIDWAAYERETDFEAKVIAASKFEDELEAEFTPQAAGARRAFMRSTKLRTVIEFRPGEVTVWAGFNGHRKSMFLGQVMLDLCEQEQRALAVSLEMLPRKTLGRMCVQATANDVPSQTERRRFMRWTDGRLWIFDHVGRLVPSKALALCRYFSDKHQGAHVFIDSFMKVCESEESMDEQKQMIGDLCDVAKETGLHVHVVAHCRKPAGGSEDKAPTKYDIKGSGAITDQAHNVCLLWANKPKQAESEKREPKADVMTQPDQIVVIDKQRNGKVEGKFGLFFDGRTLRFCDDATSPVEPYDMEAIA